MSRRRIEYNAADGSHYAQALNQLDAHAKSAADGQLAAAAGAADRAAAATEHLADQALVDAADAETSRRDLAAELDVVHGTVNYRIKRARARMQGETTDEEEQQ